ncbi:MAG: DUF456 domain-containing protein [Bacteroidales bacterium]|nr:DUF456 domain-containing protein [Bacteroidales bacterium]MBO7365951.1 DUF456 domain-containing protein [Bacteroidales bacterium]MBP5235799.1 DUF456 domain-containing protein [Bacteroidales bacterium]MBP5740212.1 DUF456 domain-containing protein [Bacteroidales bacterium]
MSTFLIILAVILGVVGIIGSIVPGLPGPPLSWLGLLLAYFAGGTNAAGDPITMKFLLIWLVVTTIVTILDYFVPAWFTKLTGGSKYAGRGAIAGLIIGMIVPPVGVIIGSLAGAFLAELIYGQKDAPDSLKSAFGAFLGFLFGTGVKLIAAGLMMYYIIVYI